MASRRLVAISAATVALLAASGYYLYQAFAVQGQGVLAQAPLNIQSSVTPAFIMAVDDSGSMTAHNQFPATDGKACWSSNSFFQSAGVLRTSSGCDFGYSYTGPRYSGFAVGIPPIDAFGFARSPDFNPAYFNPEITYRPWLNADGTAYPNASLNNTQIDPRSAGGINLASWVSDANARSLFTLRAGMVLPNGTQFRLTRNVANNQNLGNNGSCGGLTNPNNANWGSVGATGHTMSNNSQCEAYIRYWPATFYLRETVNNTAPTISATGYAGITPVRIANACGTDCHLWRYTITSGDTVALQNFANWFSYYGNRNRAMIAGMTHAMASVNNLRIGYFTINSGRRTSGNNTFYDNYSDVAMRNMLDPGDRSALYNDMVALDATGNTPNLPAVAHIGKQFERTGDNAPVQLACQKNAGMLFTDGLANVAVSGFPAITHPHGAPFTPVNANSMAAIATKYYLNTNNTIGEAGNSPLNTTLPAGQVPVPAECNSLDPDSVAWKRLDCQTNLHMNFYGVTLGARGDTFNPDIDQDPFVLNPAWPGFVSGQRSTVDDLWQATVNTRGELINARTPVDIIAAMRRILRAVGEGKTPSGSIGVTGSRIGTGSLTVVPFYETLNEGTDWYSTLTAQSVSSNPLTGQVSLTTLWEASSQLPAAAARDVWFGASDGTVKQFNAGNLALGDLCDNPRPGMSLCTGNLINSSLGVNISQAVAYLLGDSSQEVANGGPLRDRTGPLGDIINSTPVVVSPSNDYGYRSLRDSDGNYDALNYAAYLASKGSASGPPSMVYAGANDGMLHAFHGQTGVEEFAYIPSTARGHMGNLLFPYVDDEVGQVFEHRYYVDGPITVSDTHYSGGWHTTLVGTSGAGGRSVFALDVTDPTSFNAGKRRWEINDQHGNATVANNIGHVLGRPVIVPVKNTSGTVSWKAIFGNGYNSQNGQAALFVVDIGTGNVQVIPAVEAAAPAGGNGLGNIVVIDRWGGSTLNTPFRDGYADTVYAGDQKGAIWRFDLRSANPPAQTTPVFIAQDPSDSSIRQPIMGGLTAAFGPGGGVMIYFGTGSFSFVNDSDSANSHVQTLYAVNDRGGSTALTRADLHVQTITADANGVAQVSSTPMTAGKSGWRIDLPAGERFVGYPEIANGIAFFPTYDPEASVGCVGNGSNRLFGLNALNGSAGLAFVRVGSPTGDPFASGTGAVPLNTGGSAPAKDVAVMTTPRIAPLGSGTTDEDLEAALAAQCSMVVQAPGAPPLYMPRACGRQSWRQVR